MDMDHKYKWVVPPVEKDLGLSSKKEENNNFPKLPKKPNNFIGFIKLLHKFDKYPIKKTIQIITWVGKEVTVKQTLYLAQNREYVDTTAFLIKGQDPITFASLAPKKDWNLVPRINPLEDESYKPKKTQLSENTLINKEQDKEKANKIAKEFINETFGNCLKEAVNLLEKGEENFTEPLKKIFRENSIFKGTKYSFGWIWFQYMDSYFKEFVLLKPVKVEVDRITKFLFTKDWLIITWDYTFYTKDNNKIEGSFAILLWKDENWYHFKTFHSAFRNKVINY